MKGPTSIEDRVFHSFPALASAPHSPIPRGLFQLDQEYYKYRRAIALFVQGFVVLRHDHELVAEDNAQICCHSALCNTGEEQGKTRLSPLFSSGDSKLLISEVILQMSKRNPLAGCSLSRLERSALKAWNCLQKKHLKPLRHPLIRRALHPPSVQC
jgi:hypothetical protein